MEGQGHQTLEYSCTASKWRHSHSPAGGHDPRSTALAGMGACGLFEDICEEDANVQRFILGSLCFPVDMRDVSFHTQVQ